MASSHAASQRLRASESRQHLQRTRPGPSDLGWRPSTGMKPPANPMGPMSGPSRMMPPMQAGLGQQPGHVPPPARMGNASGRPSPRHQHTKNHLEQLEQEYDAAADMMEEGTENEDTSSGPGPYPGG
ncbi:hypothetical protein OPQ81_008070 [Rhizoctonia solani]|nr:hypothetical protein OPQ81_008070 [Rhizoctonia solani]